MHPFLHIPTVMVHPCRSADVLALLGVDNGSASADDTLGLNIRQLTLWLCLYLRPYLAGTLGAQNCMAHFEEADMEPLNDS
jgi:hypothetical protein